nr:hypothetical protein [Tanacetum cinerariifolium]
MQSYTPRCIQNYRQGKDHDIKFYCSNDIKSKIKILDHEHAEGTAKNSQDNKVLRHKLKEEHKRLYVTLTEEQKGIYKTIMDAVDKNNGGMFFVYGYGGTGKTYLYKTMSAACRSQGGIVLNVASSGIAALLLEGGRTAQSRFAIPINVVEDSMCNISADSELAELLRMAKLIIWDEAPMVNRHCYEAFDRTMRDICSTDPSTPSEHVFGGKVVVFGGDFRRILLVVPNGSQKDVVHAAINSSYLWNHCTIMKLTVNMRLGSGSNSSEKKEIQDFADWILNIENDLLQNLYDPDYFQERAILAPTHELVDMINDRMLSLISGDEKTYNSSDTVGVADVDTSFNDTMYTEEFLNNLNMAGIPHHSIKLKIGTPVMYMRNID